MNICLTLSAAVRHRAGIGRYTQELLAALLALDLRWRTAPFTTGQPARGPTRLPTACPR